MKRMLANVRQLIHSHKLDLENQLCVGWNSGRVGVKEGTAVDANDCKHIMSTDDQMSFSHTELTSWKVRRLNSTEHKHIFTRHAPTQPKKRILVFRDTLPSIGPLWFNLQSSRFTLAHRHDGLIPLWETKDQCWWHTVKRKQVWRNRTKKKHHYSLLWWLCPSQLWSSVV